jgi:acetyl-CoA acetyltransferase
MSQARDCRQRPVRIAAAARAMARQSSLLRNYFREDATDLPDAKLAAAALWKQSGMGPRDIDAVMIYDMFSPMVLMALEAYGFCPKGEAAKFVADGHIGRGGSLPVNTNGGLLGEGYVHGFNGITEGVRQLRGSAANQVGEVSSVVVAAAPPLPTSALVLTVEGT